MTPRLVTLATVAMALATVLAIGLGEAAAAPAASRSRRARAEKAPRAPAVKAEPRPAVLYLNGDGAPMRGGADDPEENRASALGSREQRVAVPPFAGSAEEWDDVVACVRRGFAPFAVEVVTRRPAERGYSMIVVGGAPAMLPSLMQKPEHIGGYAPVGTGADRELVGFVFSDALDGNLAKVCQGILHESGHLFGLDHVYACEDPMSYLSCGEQRFMEIEQPCGESEPRTCRYPGGKSGALQSSARLLAANVGWRDGKPPPPPAPVTGPPPHHALPVLATLDQVIPLDDDDDDDGDGDPSPPFDAADNASPNVVDSADRAAAAGREREARRAATARAASLELRGLAEQPGNGFLELVVEAHSDRHIADAALRWSSSLQSLSFACGELMAGKNPDASCRRQGNVFFFRIRAGTGQRAVRAIALDGRDVWLVSGDAMLTLQ